MSEPKFLKDAILEFCKKKGIEVKVTEINYDPPAPKTRMTGQELSDCLCDGKETKVGGNFPRPEKERKPKGENHDD